MTKVFVDTAAWIALINVDDDFHEQAGQVKTQLKKEKKSLVTSDFILLEVADGLSFPSIRTRTIRFINRLKEAQGLLIIPISQTLFNQGWTLYSKRLDKEWGLTDCISFVIMQQQEIKMAFTSDKHFEQAGFTRLLKWTLYRKWQLRY
jgi:predicted nucleic acid-binding protein